MGRNGDVPGVPIDGPQGPDPEDPVTITCVICMGTGRSPKFDAACGSCGGKGRWFTSPPPRSLQREDYEKAHAEKRGLS